MHFRKRHQTDSEMLKYISGVHRQRYKPAVKCRIFANGGGCDVPDFE